MDRNTGPACSGTVARHQPEYAWAYDAQGRVTNKGQTVGGITRTVGYAYTNGNMTTMTTPSGQSVVYGYTNGRPTSISINGTTLLSGVQYDPFGPPRSWNWGNGTTTTRTMNADGNFSQISSAGSYTYAYDDAFRIDLITDNQNSNLSWDYGYDGLDRLTSAIKPSAVQGWSYDSNGNRLSASGSPAPAYGSNNVILSYNYRGRMASSAANGTTTYTYNALGQRIRKAGSVVGTTLFAYDEAGNLLGEYDGAGSLIQETIWLADIPVATVRSANPSGIYYVHVDHLGVPRRVTRPSDNTSVWTLDSDPFGNGAPNENPAGLGAFSFRLRFPGQYADVESGLNYNYFRDYDPNNGRFAEADPIGLDDGTNVYAYVTSNPVDSVDDDGSQARSVNGFPTIGVMPSGLPYLQPVRPNVLQPLGRVEINGPNSCGECLNLFFVARVTGFSRGAHTRQANQQFYEYLNSGGGPLSYRIITREMRGPNGNLRNPTGFEWHHPIGRPNEVWLLAQCQHRGDIWQSMLHPSGVGGYATYYVGPPSR